MFSGKLNFFRLVIIVAVARSAAPALAQDSVFRLDDIRGSGNTSICNEDNVQAISFGSDTSFLFNDLRLEFPAGSPATKFLHSRCSILGTLVIPQGYHIAGIRHAVAYGAVKTRGSVAAVKSVVTFLAPSLVAESFRLGEQFAFNEQLDEPLLILETTREVRELSRKLQCRKTRSADYEVPVRMEIGLNAFAVNPNKTTLILGVDSSDVSFDLGANLEPCKGHKKLNH